MSTPAKLSFREFLVDTRSRVDKGESPSWIVLGNEAADLDSTVSCLVTAYALYLQNESIQLLCVPVLPLLETKFPLRNDIVQYFNHLNISWKEALYFLDYLGSLPLTTSTTFSFSIFLVDANDLPSTLSSFSPSSFPFSFWSTKVKAILDHHEDLHHYRSASPRKITQVMSATTLVILEFFPLFTTSSSSGTTSSTKIASTTPNCDDQTLTLLSQLCIAPLIVDTQNWRSATHLDQEALQWLLPYLPIATPSTTRSTTSFATVSSSLSNWMTHWATQLRTWKTHVTCSIPLWLEKDLKRYRITVPFNVTLKSMRNGSDNPSSNPLMVSKNVSGSFLGCYEIASIPQSLREWVHSSSTCNEIQSYFQAQLQNQSISSSSSFSKENKELEKESPLTFLFFSILSTHFLDSFEQPPSSSSFSSSSTTTTSSSSSSFSTSNTQVERFFLFLTHFKTLERSFHEALLNATDLELVPYPLNLEYWSTTLKVNCYQVKTPELTRKKLQPKLDDILKTILPLVELDSI